MAMRFSSVAGEAWRNLVTGTTRALVYAACFVAVIGVIGCVDVRAVVGVLQQAEHFRESGAAVHIVKAEGMIDGRRCDVLSGVEGITSAGALRQGSPVRFWAMPNSSVQTVEVTPGLLGILPTITQMQTGSSTGVWLSADLAETLGASPGSLLQSSAGPVTVAGVYTWPNDGRARDLGYAMITPVPADGRFSQCWAAVWPPPADGAGLIYTSVQSWGTDSQISVGQLNASLGSTFDTTTLLAHRVTASAPWAALVVGLVLGWIAVRSRRLELASALHADVTTPTLAIQISLETLAWTACATIITAAGLLWASRINNLDPSLATWIIGLHTDITGLAATLLGALAAAVTTREKHLFRYTKDH